MPVISSMLRFRGSLLYNRENMRGMTFDYVGDMAIPSIHPLDGHHDYFYQGFYTMNSNNSPAQVDLDLSRFSFNHWTSVQLPGNS